MHDLTTPRLTGNEGTCRLVERSFADRGEVGENEAAADLCPTAARILRATAPVGTECRLGDIIGHISTAAFKASAERPEDVVL